MEALEAIFTRRSIRKYLQDPVSDDELRILLKAGMLAPSANNGQPWHFIVVNKRSLLNAITEFHPWSKMLLEAPLAIIVCAYVPRDKLYDMWIQDCAAASQNILLAAHAIGLGGVWLGVHPRQERVSGVVKLFNLSEEIKPFSILVIGHPSEKAESVDRFHHEKIHINRW